MDPHRRHHTPIHPPSPFDSPRYHHLRFSAGPPPPPPPLHHHILPSPSPPPPPLHHHPRDPRHFPQHHRDDTPPYIPSYPHHRPGDPSNPRDVLIYVPQHVPPPQDRILYPEDHRPRRIPRDAFDDEDDAEDVRVRAFDGGLRMPIVREDPDVRQLIAHGGRLEVVSRKRQRREHSFLDEENLPVMEGRDARSQRKVGFWGGSRDGFRRADEPFEPDPPELASSPRALRSVLVTDRYSEMPFIGEQEMVERERVYVPEEFELVDRQDYRERQFPAKGKNVVFSGGSSSQDVVPTRKKSVWQRLEERNEEQPYSPSSSNYHGSFDHHNADLPIDLDVSFKSNAFVGKEISLSPSRDAPNYERRNSASLERGFRKEPGKDSSASPNSSGKATVFGIPIRKRIGRQAASGKDALPVFPEKKLTLDEPASPRISTLRPDSHGKTTSSGPPKENLAIVTSEKPVIKSLVYNKSLERRNEVSTSKISVSLLETEIPAKRTANNRAVQKKSGESPSGHQLISNPQTLPHLPKKKVVEKVPGAPGKVAEKVSGSSGKTIVKPDTKLTSRGTPKKRVVIRKRLVPRGTSVLKSNGKGTIVGTSTSEEAKELLTSSVSDMEALKIEISEEGKLDRKSSIPEMSVTKSSSDIKINENPDIKNTQHMPVTPNSPTVKECHFSLTSKEKVNHEALVSPSESNLRTGGVEAHGKVMHEQILIQPAAPMHQPGENTPIDGKPSDAIKVSLNSTILSSTITGPPQVVTGAGALPFPNSKVLAGALVNNIQEENVHPVGVVPPAMTSSSAVDEIVKESVISRNPVSSCNGEVTDIFGTQSKKKKRVDSQCTSVDLLGSSPIDKARGITMSVIHKKDPLNLEEPQSVPSRKRIRKKKKTNTRLRTPVWVPPLVYLESETKKAEILKAEDELLGSSMEALKLSGDIDEGSKPNGPCSNQNQLNESRHIGFPPSPCDVLNPSGVQNVSSLSNSGLVTSSNGMLKSVFGCSQANFSSSHFDLRNDLLQKLSTNISAETVATLDQEDGSCRQYCEEQDARFSGEIVQSQMVLESQLSVHGGPHQPVPVEVPPCSAGDKGTGEDKVMLEKPLASQCLLKVNPVTNAVVSNLENSGDCFFPLCSDSDCKGEIDRKIEEIGMHGIDIEEKNPITCTLQRGDPNGVSSIKMPQQDGLLPLEVHGSSTTLKSSVIAYGESNDTRLLVENELIGSANSNLNREPKPMIAKQKPSLQTEDLHNLVDNIDDASILKPVIHSKNSLNLETKRGTNHEKSLPATVASDKNTPPLSSKGKKQVSGGSQVVTREEPGLASDGIDHAKRRVFPKQGGLPVRHLAGIAPGLNGRHRTWRRTDPSVVLQSPAHLNTSITNSLRGHPPRRSERVQGSYVRKGNSLIRKSNESTPVPQRPSAPGSSNKFTSELCHGRSSETTIDGFSSLDNAKSGQKSYIERPKTPPLPLSLKQSDCIGKLPPSSNPSLSKDIPSEAAPEDPCTLSKAANSETCILTGSSISNSESSKANDLKRMVYVKHKSNQLVATKGYETSNLAHSNPMNQVLASSSTDLYYTRKNNTLVRDTSYGSLTKHDNLGPTDFSRGNETATKKHIAEMSFGKVTHAGKSYKQSKSSFVWRLNSVLSRGKDNAPSTRQQVLPYIFPWKRASYRRSSMINNSKSRSLKLISRKLQISRRSDVVYAVSQGGFSLWKSAIRSIGGRSLKWSKSIEKRARKANEEATLAFAEVEKKGKDRHGGSYPRSSSKIKKGTSKEQIIRVGNVRYKMDSSKRTLVRIPGEESANNLELGQNSLKSIIPRRLMIGNDEYIRVGNGNQLVRDPKRFVRILASEKVRWSLHTARLRLAKKQQYCQFFTRYGKCNKEGKKCPYIHDPTKVAVCTKFLKGLCSGTNCNLTHKVIPERMPDCSYFLQGLCTNADCPYRHVNVNPGASICEGFLKGYCGDGDECRKKHSYVCPDFEATGKCFKGTECKLHHPKLKNKSKKRKRSDAKVHGKGRYFRSSMPDAAQKQILGAGPNADDGRNGDLSSDGCMADYISLDVDFEDDSTDRSDRMDFLPNEPDSDLSDTQVYDLDSYIKPIRLMKRMKCDSAEAAAIVETA